VPDVGAPGEGYVTALPGLLANLDPRPRVRVLRLPGLTEDGDDIEQWIAARPEVAPAEVAVGHVGVGEGRVAEHCLGQLGPLQHGLAEESALRVGLVAIGLATPTILLLLASCTHPSGNIRFPATTPSFIRNKPNRP